MLLPKIGYNDFFEINYLPYKEKNYIPARVIRENKTNYIILSELGELTAHLAGKMLYEQEKTDKPVVGDWVVIKPQSDNQTAVIHAVLPRQTSVERKTAGDKTEIQVIAVNIDKLILVVGLDDNFNLRRIERYLTMIYDSGAEPIILLNKADLCENVDEFTAKVESIAFGIPVLPVSAVNKTGLIELEQYLIKEKTIALIGSSGVGKSTIINHFLNSDKLKVKSVSDEKSQGRHTTTHRELIVLPNGAIMIDTPGMRELQLWGDEDNVAQSFADIENLSEACRFVDCKHETEPGCAVKNAIKTGELDKKRFNNYLKQLKELKHLSSRKDQLGRHELKQKGKKFAARIKDANNFKKRNNLKPL